MSKLVAKPEISKRGEELKSMLPHGWTNILIKRATRYNEENPDYNPLPTTRAGISRVVARMQTDHPLWPFVDELIRETLPKANLKQEHDQRLEQFLSLRESA